MSENMHYNDANDELNGDVDDGNGALIDDVGSNTVIIESDSWSPPSSASNPNRNCSSTLSNSKDSKMKK